MAKRSTSILQLFIVVCVFLVAVVPFYLLILISLKSPQGGLSALQLVPDWHLDNFSAAWAKSQMGRAMLNNFIITTGGVLLLVLLSSMAGYSIARVGNIVNKAIFTIFLLCMMVPGIINTVPLYTLLIKIKGIDTYWAMIFVLTTNALPFSVFLYTGFIKTVDTDLEESAMMDGCSHARSFWLIIFPLLKPVTASVIILQGLTFWNNYAQAVFFLQSQKMRNIPLAISLFFQQYGANWPHMAAAALIGLFPAVVAFLFFQKLFISGMFEGSVKG